MKPDFFFSISGCVSVIHFFQGDRENESNESFLFVIFVCSSLFLLFPNPPFFFLLLLFRIKYKEQREQKDKNVINCDVHLCIWKIVVVVVLMICFYIIIQEETPFFFFIMTCYMYVNDR